ncbi:MAG: hypothetical protein GX154_01355 [Clostridiales bacterium]|nr:hypothetical protein [Clostridiales bacterium]
MESRSFGRPQDDSIGTYDSAGRCHSERSEESVSGSWLQGSGHRVVVFLWGQDPSVNLRMTVSGHMTVPEGIILSAAKNLYQAPGCRALDTGLWYPFGVRILRQSLRMTVSGHTSGDIR